MIRVGNIKVPLDFDFTRLKDYCTDRLGISAERIKSVKLAKKSVDARRKNDVHFLISVDISAKGETALLKRLKDFNERGEYIKDGKTIMDKEDN